MKTLKVVPLIWTPEDKELNPEVHRLARIFVDENMENPPEDFRWYMKTWIVVEVDGDALKEARGIMALRREIDVPLFHLKTPEKNREAIVDFARGYEMLAQRGRQFLIDSGLEGQSILVHVSEKSESATMVKYLSNRLQMKPAHRYILEV